MSVFLHGLALENYRGIGPKAQWMASFKQFNIFSPYKYLQDLRLKNAEMLLKSTTLSITDVCFMSGFNSLDYFSTAFSKKYKLSPSKYRSAVCR